MKRRELVRHLERFGCVLADEGAKHSKYVNLADPRRVTTVPRHTEIADFSRARFAANSVSQTQSKRIAYIVWTF